MGSYVQFHAFSACNSLQHRLLVREARDSLQRTCLRTAYGAGSGRSCESYTLLFDLIRYSTALRHTLLWLTVAF